MKKQLYDREKIPFSDMMQATHVEEREYEDVLTTKRLSYVENGNISALPTGALKIEEGMIFQEVMVIVHKEKPDKPVGIYYEWWLVPKEFIFKLKQIKESLH